MKKFLVLSILVTFMGSCAHHQNGSQGMHEGGKSCAAGCKEKKCSSCEKEAQAAKDKSGGCEECKKGG